MRRLPPSLATQEQKKLVEENLLLARKLAGKYFKRRSHLEFDDIYSYAVIGLIDAAKKYDPSHGAKFSTYAYTRIRGEIVSALERIEFGAFNRAGFAPSFVEYFDKTTGLPSEQHTRDKVEAIRQCYPVLNDVEIDIIESRLAGVSTEELGKKYDVVKGWIWKLEKRAVNKIRRYMDESVRH